MLANASKFKLKTLSLLVVSMLMGHLISVDKAFDVYRNSIIVCNGIGFYDFGDASCFIKYHGLMSFVILC
jgi:S-adenosylmethionine:tRNA-ribosyltransferase-isomerase (queuine synthetase)